MKCPKVFPLSILLLLVMTIAQCVAFIPKFHQASQQMAQTRLGMSKTHEKALIRIAKMKEKEKEINRLKTHYGKDFKKMIKLHGKHIPSPPSPPVTKIFSKRKLDVQRKLHEIKQHTSSTVMAAVPSIQLILKNPLLLNISSAINVKKANYMSSRYIGHISSIAEILMVVEGNNKPHIQSLVDEIERVTKKAGFNPPSIQGKASSGWVLVDYGPIMVNIMSPLMRNFYKLEERWNDGLTLPLGMTELTPDSMVDDKVDHVTTENPIDPFWS